MERKIRFIWWGVLIILIIGAIWKLFLPHGSKAYLEKTSSSREIVVYVTGAVEKPGLVHLSPDARLDDALKQAKPLMEANLDLINPAERVKDGQKITVPYRTGMPPATGGNNQTANNPGGNNQGSSAQAVSTPNPGQTSVSPAGQANNSAKININTAGPAELDKLPGVGPALAERIIQYRTEHGPFSKPDDLQNVSGIGPKTYEKMSALITVGP